MGRPRQQARGILSVAQGPPGRSPGSEKPQNVVIKDAVGLFTNYDAADIQTGAAQVQVNVVGERVGYIQVRGGFITVKFRS